MKEFGRILKMDWGDKVVVLGIYCKSPKELKIPKEGKLYKLFEFDGEIIEKEIGTPSAKIWGHSLNDIITNTGAWITKEESKEIDELVGRRI